MTRASLRPAVVSTLAGCTVAASVGTVVWTALDADAQVAYDGPLQAALGLAGLALLACVRWGPMAILATLSRGTVVPVKGWAAVGLVGGMLLTLAWPVRLPAPVLEHSLSIVATGEKNPASASAEVWLLEARDEEGQVIPPAAFERDSGWELRGGKAQLSYRAPGARLSWSGTLQGDVSLVFLAHSHSGFVEIEWDDEPPRRLDLFREGSEYPVVTLPAAGGRDAGVPEGWLWFQRWLSHVVVFGMLVLWAAAAMLGVSTGGGPAAAGSPTTLREWLPYVVLPVTSGLCCLLAYFPGLMTSDSIDQWHQARHGRFVDAHPVAHTLLIRTLVQLWASPASVALFQLVAYGGLVGWGFRLLAGFGVSRVIRGGLSLVLALWPLYPLMAITLWKDVLFSYAVVGLVLLLLELSRTAHPRLSGVRFWGGWCALMVTSYLFRHNGLPATLGAAVGLVLLAGRAQWKQAVLAGVVATTLALTVRAAIFHLYKPTPVGASVALVGLLGAYVASDVPLSPADREVLDDIHPLADRWNYDCITQGTTLFDGRFDGKALTRHSPLLRPLLGRLLLEDPLPALKHLGCSSSMLWKVLQEDDLLNGPALIRLRSGEPRTIDPPDESLPPVRLFEGWYFRFTSWVFWTRDPAHSWLFWRPALPSAALLLAALVVLSRRQSPRLLAAGLPLLLHTGALVLVMPSPDVRYQFPVLLGWLFLVPAWLWGSATLQRPPRADTEAAA